MTPRETVVGVSAFAAGGEGDVLVTVGLGSCVGILLHDAEARVGGLAHVLLPSPALARGADVTGKFPQTAVPALLELMTGRGASTRRVTARLVGGASMFANLAPPGTIQMGERNLVASRQVLHALGIPLTAQATGGDFGRTVRLHCGDGRAEVSSVAHGVALL